MTTRPVERPRYWVKVCGGLAALVALAATARADAPLWWAIRGVAITNGAVLTNDFAAANLGQLKNMATAGAAELQAQLSGGAGPVVTGMVGAFTQSNNYSAVTLGQLKSVAKPFYDRLREAGWPCLLPQGMTTNQLYPWTGTGAQDFAVANLGQVKYVFSFTILKVDIKKDGVVITDTTTNVIVGEKMALQGVVQPLGLTITSNQWTIQNANDVIANWDPTAQPDGDLEAHAVPLTHLNTDAVNFYWVNGSFGGSERTVKYSVTVNGTVCEGQTTLRVFRPTAEVTTSHDQVRINDSYYQSNTVPYNWLHFGQPYVGEPGITVSRTVTIPSGFLPADDIWFFNSQGTEWIQLASVSRYFRRSGDAWFMHACNDYLDYGPFDSGLHTETNYYDSPAQGLLPDDKEVRVVNESFKLWLMFKPAGADSIFIPLKQVNWGWSAATTRPQGGWSTATLDSSAVAPISVNDTTTYPEWSQTVNDVVEQSVTGPP